MNTEQPEADVSALRRVIAEADRGVVLDNDALDRIARAVVDAGWRPTRSGDT